jgi:hypothetical protein
MHSMGKWFYIIQGFLQMRYEKFGINGQLRNKLFLNRFSLVRAAMNAICKMRSGVSKTPSISSFFNCPMRNEHLRSYLNCCTIVN